MSGYENKVKELHPELDILHIPKYVIEKAVVRNRYGECEMALNTLLAGGKPNLLNAIDKTKYFAMLLYFRNKHFRGGEFFITGKYTGQKNKIEVTTSYGKCLADVVSLWQGYMPRIPTAVDKNEYFKRMVWDKNKYYRAGQFQIIGDYKKVDEHILLKDKYGLLKIRPSAILNGNQNTIFSAVDKTAYWINKAREVQGDRYDYSYVNYKSSRENIKIVCKEHGEFKQSPASHLKGTNCPMCAKEIDRGGWSYSGWEHLGRNSDNFDSYKVYIIECWDNDTKERFYKIGKTMQKLKHRFDWVRLMPYNYKPVVKFISVNNSADNINNLEKEIKSIFKGNKYVPQKEFQGYTECFNKVDLNTLFKMKSYMEDTEVELT